MLKQKPDVILIGYQKAGTHYLRSYFSNHPEIEWSRTPGYFGIDGKYKAVDYYDKNAKAGKKCFIDMYENLAVGFIWKDPDFDKLEEPKMPIDEKVLYIDPIEIARRIKETVPDAKIIISIREQLDWVRANYLYFLRALPRGKKRFEDFASTLEGKGVLSGGMYHVVIEEYYKLFGKENVHINLLEEIRSDRERAFQGLCGFLGVRYVVPPHEKMKMYKGIGNAGGNIVKILSSIGFSNTMINKVAPAFRWSKRYLYRIFDREVLSRQEIALIKSIYAVSNYRTSKLTGIDLRKYGYHF